MDDSEMLQEVVETGMQQMDKRLLRVLQTDWWRDVVDGIPSQCLEDVPGCICSKCIGYFGTAPKIRVRGATYLWKSGPPWVVDGVIMR